MPAVSVRRIDGPSVTRRARPLQPRRSCTSSSARPPSLPPRRCARSRERGRAGGRSSSAFSMRVQQRLLWHTSTAVACARHHPPAPSARPPRDTRAGRTAWPRSSRWRAIAASSRARPFLASSLTMERSHGKSGTRPPRPARWRGGSPSPSCRPWPGLHEHHLGAASLVVFRRAQCAPPGPHRRKQRSRIRSNPGRRRSPRCAPPPPAAAPGVLRVVRRQTQRKVGARFVGEHLVLQVEMLQGHGDPLFGRVAGF